MTTAEALERINEAEFELLAVRSLRELEPDCRAVIHLGMNAQGKTIPGPLDGFCRVPGVNPPRFVIIAATATKLTKLKEKWLSSRVNGDPAATSTGVRSGKRRNSHALSADEGDLPKAATQAASLRRQYVTASFVLYLATNRNLSLELESTVRSAGDLGGLEVRFLEQSRLRDFLDTKPVGQWLRQVHLGIEADQVSLPLVQQICKENLRRYFKDVAMVDDFASLDTRSSRLLLDRVKDPTRALTLIDEILESVPKDREGGDNLTKDAIQILTGWYVWKNEPAASAAIARITSNVAERAKQAVHIPFAIREVLTHGAMEDSGEPAAIRGRAVELLRALSKQSCDAVRSHLENSNQDQQHHSGRESSARSLFSLANIVASELYFAAGAFQEGRASLPAVVTRPEQPRLYREAESVFDDLSSIGFPALAHRLVETLEMYIDTDPRGVFLRLAAVVSAGKRWNFEYEQLAQDVVLRIVRRYLADKRALLQDDEKCQRALREVLETFIEAGWPAAQHLAYRIDEIHR
jgi:hypothetical protein